MADRWHHLVLSLEVSYSNWILYAPGEIIVNWIEHYGHLEYLVHGNRKKTWKKNTYQSLEIKATLMTTRFQCTDVIRDAIYQGFTLMSCDLNSWGAHESNVGSALHVNKPEHRMI